MLVYQRVIPMFHITPCPSPFGQNNRRLLRARVDQLLLDLAGPQVAQQAHGAWSHAEEKGNGILIGKWVISGLYSGLDSGLYSGL